MKLTTEYALRLYDDDSGDYLALSPNVDGAGLFEIRSVASGQTEGCLVLTGEQVDALIEGLKKLRELNMPIPKLVIDFPISGVDITPGPIVRSPEGSPIRSPIGPAYDPAQPPFSR